MPASPANGMVTITQAEYDSLRKDALKLEALECAGVDNWDGYHYHWEEYQMLLKQEGFDVDDEF